MTTAPILLILGAGPNIGAHVAKAFAAKGYKVATASRRTPPESDYLHVPVDLSKPESVPGVFETVKAKLGAAPSVVVYNAAFAKPDNPADPLTEFSLSTFATSQAINTTSVVVAMQQSVLGFRTLTGSGLSKTFIFTGNMLNVKIMAPMLMFGLGKVGAAYAIKGVVESKAYEKEGFKFYYVDERSPTGDAVYNDIDGPAAAAEYPVIADLKTQGPWMYTFVKGAGYKDFDDGSEAGSRTSRRKKKHEAAKLV